LSADPANHPTAASGLQAGQPDAGDRLADRELGDGTARRPLRRAESAPDPVRGLLSAVLERSRSAWPQAGSGPDQVKGTAAYAPSSSDRGHSCPAPAQPDGPPAPELGVLACRIAGSLVHHEPGWRLPRFSILARHFGVTTEQVAAAVDQLADRRLVRLQADGRFSRLSPAEYHLPLSAQACVRTAAIPVGGALTCRARAVTNERLREDVAWALGATAGAAGCVLKLQYAVDEESAALSTTYMTAAFRSVLDKLAAAELPELLLLGGEAAVDRRGSRSVQVEMLQPVPGVASLIHLAPGQKAIVITTRFDPRAAGGAAALTVAVLRPERFRIQIGSADRPLLAWYDYPAEGEQATASPGDF
jgi:DNA-binding GntR family transcriptional regulator